MKQSKLFTKTKKFAPKDEVAKNAQLLIKAGYIHKEMAGVYSYLPLGFRVLEKISKIVKEEMDKIGGVQVKSSALQKKEVWEKTDRWDDEVVDNWFKTKLKNGTEVGLAFTHEEFFTNLMKDYIESHRDLPVYPYDIRDMFRNEIRSKSGIMRGREFYWKALYSFSKNKEEHNLFYEKAKEAYQEIFKKVGLSDKTYLTFASGGTFSEFSHEFQTISEAGEDIIYIDEEKKIAVNEEVYNDEVLNNLGLKKEKLVKRKSIETGNIFTLGDKFSKPLNLTYKNEKGEEIPVFMGSYGMGFSRLMGTIVEVFSDDKGIIWPESVAPFQVHLINIGVEEEAEKLYKKLHENNIEVLWDDRKDRRPGEKFADSDLIGIPYRIVISERSLKDGGMEIKKRAKKDSQIVSDNELFKILIS